MNSQGLGVGIMGAVTATVGRIIANHAVRVSNPNPFLNWLYVTEYPYATEGMAISQLGIVVAIIGFGIFGYELLRKVEIKVGMKQDGN